MSSSERVSGGGDVQPFAFNKTFKHGAVHPGATPPGDTQAEALEKARERAVREGEKAGFEAGMARAGDVVTRLQGLVNELETARASYYAKMEQEMVDLICRIAEKVVHAELRADPAARVAVLSAGLEKLREQENIHIRMSPDDYELVEEALPALCEREGVGARVALQEDASLSPGSYVLESDQCEVDARVEAALARIEEALKGS